MKAYTEISVCCLMYRVAQRSATFHFQSLYHVPVSKKHDTLTLATNVDRFSFFFPPPDSQVNVQWNGH